MKGRGSVFPYKIRVTDPQLEMVLKRLAKNRASPVEDRGTARLLGKKLKPIRKNIFMGADRNYYKTFVALPPEINIEIDKKDFIFRWL